MLRHIVAWNFADGFSEEENQMNAVKLKKELKELKNLIEGIVSIDLYIQHLESSDADLLLDSVFENEEALKSYIVHPEHVRVGGFVRQVTKNRKCIDFII